MAKPTQPMTTSGHCEYPSKGSHAFCAKVGCACTCTCHDNN